MVMMSIGTSMHNNWQCGHYSSEFEFGGWKWHFSFWPNTKKKLPYMFVSGYLRVCPSISRSIPTLKSYVILAQPFHFYTTLIKSLFLGEYTIALVYGLFWWYVESGQAMLDQVKQKFDFSPAYSATGSYHVICIRHKNIFSFFKAKDLPGI